MVKNKENFKSWKKCQIFVQKIIYGKQKLFSKIQIFFPKFYKIFFEIKILEKQKKIVIIFFSLLFSNFYKFFYFQKLILEIFKLI